MTFDRDWRLVLDGDRTGTASTLVVRNPATNERIADAPAGTPADIDRAVEAARSAVDSWRWTDPEQRAARLTELAEIVRDHQDELTELETLENGKPLWQARKDVISTEKTLRYYAGAADKFHGATVADTPEEVAKKVHEPYGVVGVVIPWNWPPMHTVDFLAPAVATGNTVVLKAAPETPLSSLRIAELALEVLPDGVFNVVTGGVEPGQALTSHEDVDALAFTGNDVTGSHILDAAAEHITPALMELGGKNPAVVFEDANVDNAVTALVYNSHYNSGQACTNPERLLVQDAVYEEFKAKYARAVEDLVVGDGRADGTQVGPLVSPAQEERVTGYIDGAIDDGATVVARADRPTDPALQDGNFVPPILFEGVSPDAEIAREEVFGPVATLFSFDSEAEALAMANDTKYGLAFSVWSKDLDRAHRVATQAQAGIVTVNHPSRSRFGLPFGGYKRSGQGRKKDFLETLREFTQSKAIQINLTDDVPSL